MEQLSHRFRCDKNERRVGNETTDRGGTLHVDLDDYVLAALKGGADGPLRYAVLQSVDDRPLQELAIDTVGVEGGVVQKEIVNAVDLPWPSWPRGSRDREVGFRVAGPQTLDNSVFANSGWTRNHEQAWVPPAAKLTDQIIRSLAKMVRRLRVPIGSLQRHSIRADKRCDEGFRLCHAPRIPRRHSRHVRVPGGSLPACSMS